MRWTLVISTSPFISVMEILEVNISGIGLNVSSPKDNDYREAGDRLFQAFEEIGFVYITGHGVSSDIISKSMETSKDFFLLPEDSKKQILRDPEIQQGYVSAGQELFNSKLSYHEVRECYEVTKVEGDQALFPDELVPRMRPALTALAKQSRELAFRLLRAIALSFGQERDFFVNCHQIFTEHGISKLRSIYYPPINENVAPGVVRCGEHSDYGLITLLYQDEVGGLEVRGTNNTWIPAKPMKDAILINAGDFLEIYTNGKLPATVHRVVIPPEEVKRKTSRQSIVFFVHPDHETTIYPLPKFIEDQDDQKIDGTEKRGIFTSTKEFTNGYQPVNSLEHLFRRLNSTYQY